MLQALCPILETMSSYSSLNQYLISVRLQYSESSIPFAFTISSIVGKSASVEVAVGARK